MAIFRTFWIAATSLYIRASLHLRFQNRTFYVDLLAPLLSSVSMIAGILGLSLGFKLTHCMARRPISLDPFTEYWPASLGSIMQRNLRVLVRTFEVLKSRYMTGLSAPCKNAKPFAAPIAIFSLVAHAREIDSPMHGG
ncbi:pyridoxal-dependent decarboxylase [Striga asiatica]|uniref:Pyridoxal-dependent decarboxylase n=1 Tax=Striga asiatica TaxID=4170 RepID=A0A5A7RE68_STRAF|nr:pyridoxal-dependent decarboxylase [Striga asiatica]